MPLNFMQPQQRSNTLDLVSTLLPQRRPFCAARSLSGGHYVPAIAAYIDAQNERLVAGGEAPANVRHQLAVAETQLPLADIAVGDGWVDPRNMLSAYAPMMFNQGMLSESEAAQVRSTCCSSVTHARTHTHTHTHTHKHTRTHTHTHTSFLRAVSSIDAAAL